MNADSLVYADYLNEIGYCTHEIRGNFQLASECDIFYGMVNEFITAYQFNRLIHTP